jgi:L-serine deaminase
LLFPELEEKLRHARLALDRATTETIIECCRQYLALLDAHRSELFKLPLTMELNSRNKSSLLRQEINSNRKAIRTAIEHSTRERNRAGALLLSFTAVSGYEATATLNRLKYKGHDTWQLKAGGVRCSC